MSQGPVPSNGWDVKGSVTFYGPPIRGLLAPNSENNTSICLNGTAREGGDMRETARARRKSDGRGGNSTSERARSYYSG